MNSQPPTEPDAPGSWEKALAACAVRLRNPSAGDEQDDVLFDAALLMDGMAITSVRKLGLKMRNEIEITDYDAALRFAKSTRRFRSPKNKRREGPFLMAFLQQFVEEHRAIGDMMMAPPRGKDGNFSLPSGEMLVGFIVRPRAHFSPREGSTNRDRLAK